MWKTNHKRQKLTLKLPKLSIRYEIQLASDCVQVTCSTSCGHNRFIILLYPTNKNINIYTLDTAELASDCMEIEAQTQTQTEILRMHRSGGGTNPRVCVEGGGGASTFD